MSKKEIDVDPGMDGLDAIFDSAAGAKAPTAPAAQETPPAKKTSSQKNKKRSPLKNKSGLYFSDAVMKRLDKEFGKQPWNAKKSKSLIVEEILRNAWGLSPLEEE